MLYAKSKLNSEFFEFKNNFGTLIDYEFVELKTEYFCTWPTTNYLREFQKYC